MPRIGRSFPPQWTEPNIGGAERALGPEPPQVLAPVVTTVAVYPATGLLTNWRRAQQRRTDYRLPVVIGPPPPVVTTLSVTLAQIRPRPTAKSLRPLIFYPATSEITVALVRARSTSRTWRVSPPATLEPEAVQIAERKIRVTVVRARPRPTIRRLTPPTALLTFGPPVEVEVAVRVPVEDRRRLPRSRLPLVIVPVPGFIASPVEVALTRVRPRPTRRTLGPLIFYPATSEIAVTLVRTRPRPTRRVLTAPTALATFAGPETALTHTRPRRTQGTRLSAPQVIRVPAVEQAEETIRVTLVRTRPRPTVTRLVPPTALRVFAGPEVATVRTRPRHTVTAVRPPTVVLPLPTLREETVKVTLAGRTRSETPRRPARYRLSLPTVIIFPPVPPVEVFPVAIAARRDWQRRFPWQGQRQSLVRETGTTTTYQQRNPFIGPRPPVVIDPLPTQRAETITAWLVSVSARRGWSRSLMDQGQRQRLVRETGSTVVIPLRDPFVGPRPPQIVGPLPAQAQETVSVTLVAVRTRVEAIRRAPRSLLAEPAVVGRQPVETVLAVTLAVLQTRPRPTRALVRPPAVIRIPAGTIAIAVTLTRTRPRPTRVFLTAVSYPATSEITVALVRARPRPTIKRLTPPFTLKTFAGPTVALTRIRPRPTARFLTPPTVVFETRPPERFEIAVEITRVSLVQRRPSSKLSPPAAVAPTPLPTLDQRTIRVTLARIRPRPTTRLLAAPATLRPPPPPVPLWTDGEVLPTAETEGEIVQTGAADGSLSPAASTSGQVVLVADSAGETEPLASTDGTDERTGLT